MVLIDHQVYSMIFPPPPFPPGLSFLCGNLEEIASSPVNAIGNL